MRFRRKIRRSMKYRALANTYPLVVLYPFRPQTISWWHTAFLLSKVTLWLMLIACDMI